MYTVGLYSRGFQVYTQHPQGGLPLVGCVQLLIQYRYISNYPSHLDGISSLCNLGIHTMVVTRKPDNLVPL
jgi:hypothetical protein